MKLLRTVLIKNCLVHYSKNKFDFDEHVTSLCRKASQKLNALARVAYYMNLAQGRFIMNAFVFSQFGYCPLVWMFYSRKLNNRINNIHECSPVIIGDVSKFKNLKYKFRKAETLSRSNMNSVKYEIITALGAKIWKILPNDYKELTSLSMFKSRIKNWETDKCPCRLWKTYIQRLGFICLLNTTF